MFLPNTETNKEQETKAIKKIAFDRVEKWALKAVPEKYRNGVIANVQEFVCGDPNCSPVDTSVVLMFSSGGRGLIGVPAEVQMIEEDDLLGLFPPEDIIAKWYRGESAEWPRLEDFEDMSSDEEEEEISIDKRPNLRFDVGQKVQCRVAQDPVTGWVDGTIIQLWYREPSWPKNSIAPYKVLLDDGRKIFAPGDVDQIIRARS